jgi:hypothetical protein
MIVLYSNRRHDAIPESNLAGTSTSDPPSTWWPGEGRKMGLLWYFAAILIWWLIDSLIGGHGQHSAFAFWLEDVEFALVVTIVWYILWWLPYITWIALGELILFRRYPGRRTTFAAFAVLSLLVYSAINAVLFRNDTELLPLSIWPAIAVTILYAIRRSVRRVC